MKRILLCIESLGSGGAERQLSGLAVMLKQHGYDVEVGYYIKKEFYLSRLHENGVPTCYLPKATSAKKRFFVLRKYIRSRKPDVVISYSPATSMIAGLLKALGGKFKLIVSERNTTQVLSRREKGKFFFCRWADVIVPNSYAQGAFIKKHYPQYEPKVKVITNFVDTDFFCPDEERMFDSQVCHMACVSRLAAQKNVLGFLDVVKRLKDEDVPVQIDWYGSTNTDYGQQCIDKAKGLGLDDMICFKGETNDIRSVYRQYDVMCLPSFYEGFPNVVCEAMSCGTPILCGNVCDNGYIVTDGENGLLFDPKSVEDMAEKIKAFVTMTAEQGKAMSDANRQKALGLFSTTAFIEKYKAII